MSDEFTSRKAFYQFQAALCRRLAGSIPQERIAEELQRLAQDFARSAEAEEDVLVVADTSEAEPAETLLV